MSQQKAFDPSLSIEQSFQLRLIKEQASRMTREQLEEMLVDASQALMMKDNTIAHMIRQHTKGQPLFVLS